MKLHSRVLPGFLALCAAPATAQSTLWTVDDDAGADFTTIQAAVDASMEGDTILVRDGIYNRFVIDGKGLSVVAEEGVTLRIEPIPGEVPTVVRNLPLSSRVFLRGMEFFPPGLIDGSLLELEDCDGEVWLEEVTTLPPMPELFGYTLAAGTAGEIDNCSQVIFSNCELRSAPGDTAWFGTGLEAGQVAVRSKASSIAMFDTIASPGGTAVSSGTGLPAVNFDAGLLFLRNSTLFGGIGGSASSPFSPPGFGGPALIANGGASVVSVASDLIGGSGGMGLFGEVGPPGPPFSPATADVQEVAGLPVGLTTTRVTPDAMDDRIRVEVGAQAGSAILMLIDLQPESVFVGALNEFSALGLAPIVLPLGAVDGSGTLVLEAGVPALSPVVPFFQLAFQAAAISPSSSLDLSRPSIVTLIDDGL